MVPEKKTVCGVSGLQGRGWGGPLGDGPESPARGPGLSQWHACLGVRVLTSLSEPQTPETLGEAAAPSPGDPALHSPGPHGPLPGLGPASEAVWSASFLSWRMGGGWRCCSLALHVNRKQAQLLTLQAKGASSRGRAGARVGVSWAPF